MIELSDSISETKDKNANLKITLSDLKPFVGIRNYRDRCPKCDSWEIINQLNKKEVSCDEAEEIIYYQLERDSNLGILTLTHLSGLNIPAYLIGKLVNSYFK